MLSIKSPSSLAANETSILNHKPTISKVITRRTNLMLVSLTPFSLFVFVQFFVFRSEQSYLFIDLLKKMIRSISLILIALSIVSCDKQTKNLDFDLPFEISEGTKTATYAETMAFCAAAANSPEIHFTDYGRSSQGYLLPLLIIDKDGLQSPEQIRDAGRVILFVEANIHPGEPDGNDAMMLLLRDVVFGGKQHLLNEVSILFAPVVNPDGLMRFNAYNRINQNGPEEMGWRTNAQYLNLNRDFVKADAPEIQAWLTLYNHWLPEFFIDCHTTDGADYQYVITYMLETFGNMDKSLTNWQTDSYLPDVKQAMLDSGFPIFPYVSFRSWHDPRSGLISRPGRPMLSQGYTALQNRPGLLIETHMLKPYKTRVLATAKMIELTLVKLNAEGDNLQQMIANADKVAASPEFRKSPLTVAYENTQQHDTVDFHGVEYDVVKSDLTGGNWFQYHTDQPVVFRLPYFRYAEPSQTVSLPIAYVIPPQWNVVINRLKLHGVQMFALAETINIPTETYWFSDVEWRRQPNEGHMSISKLETHLMHDTTEFPAGSVVVETNQRMARLLAYMLEPGSDDSFLRWGFFNAVFEQKEYAETYVMETLARQMMDENPQVRTEFEQFMKENPTAKQNSWRQLNWFYERTPWWDHQKNVYPVKRVSNASVLKKLRAISY